MKKFVITINRQFGSLGRAVARELAELLHVQYFDRDIVDLAAKEMNLPVSYISDAEETAKYRFLKMSFPLGIGTSSAQDNIFEIQRQLILDIVDKGSCIVVGRCSDYILRDIDNLVRVFIYAPYSARLTNCIESLKMDEASARNMIMQVDRARDAYHMRYAHYLPSDIEHTDLMINSSILGVHGTAVLLAQMIAQKFEVTL